MLSTIPFLWVFRRADPISQFAPHAFPDVKATVEDLLADGDKVVALVSYRGTQQGALGAVSSQASLSR